MSKKTKAETNADQEADVAVSDVMQAAARFAKRTFEESRSAAPSELEAAVKTTELLLSVDL